MVFYFFFLMDTVRETPDVDDMWRRPAFEAGRRFGLHQGILSGAQV